MLNNALSSLEQFATSRHRVSRRMRDMFLVALFLFVSSLVLGIRSVAATSSNFDITIDIAEDGAHNVGYRGGGACATCETHGWRVTVVANYENVGNPADTVQLNLQLNDDGTYVPYGGSPPLMDFTSFAPLDNHDFLYCTNANKYYDRYRVQGYADDIISLSGRTYALQDFDYSVSTSSSKSSAISNLKSLRPIDSYCCSRSFVSCSGCSQTGSPNTGVTATITATSCQ